MFKAVQRTCSQRKQRLKVCRKQPHHLDIICEIHHSK
jgi:hypothetical protein